MRARERHNLKIAVIGGSVPLGAELRGAEWRYSDWMIHLLSNYPIEVHNLARGGCSSRCWAQLIDVVITPTLFDIDIIIVDVSVNDQNSPADEIANSTAELINVLHALPGQPEIVFIEELRMSMDHHGMSISCEERNFNIMNGWYYCERWWDMQTHAVPVLMKENVTWLSYRDGFWPSKYEPPPNAKLFWNGNSHPDGRVHKLLAKAIIFALAKLIEAAQVPQICSRDRDESSAWLGCFSPLWRLSALNSTSAGFEPVQTSGPWEFSSFRAGKYAWNIKLSASDVQGLCDRNQTYNSSITFAAQLPKSSRELNLQLSYVRSSDPMWGSAIVRINDLPRIVINSFDADRRETVYTYEQISLGRVDAIQLTISVEKENICVRGTTHGLMWSLTSLKVCEDMSWV